MQSCDYWTFSNHALHFLYDMFARCQVGYLFSISNGLAWSTTRKPVSMLHSIMRLVILFWVRNDVRSAFPQRESNMPSIRNQLCSHGCSTTEQSCLSDTSWFYPWCTIILSAGSWVMEFAHEQTMVICKGTRIDLSRFEYLIHCIQIVYSKH